MTKCAKWLRRSAVMLLVPAFAASMPTIQFCTLTADGTARARFAGCLEPGILDAALVTPAEASVSERAPSPAPSPVGSSACGVESSACSERACPLASHQHVACAGACAAPPPPRAPARNPASGTRHVLLYCLGDPAGGRGLRSHAPLIATPGPLVAWLAFAATVAPNEAPAQTAWPELLALAPSRLATARPPVRGPPARV